MEKNMSLEVARLIGQPINDNLPVPVELSEVADTFTAEPGEKMWVYGSYDTDADEILDIDSNGDITVVKRDPLSDTQLTFKGYNSQLEYVLVEAVVNNPDVQVLARKKARISHGMDKTELRAVLKAITDSSAVQSVTKESSEDLYDVIMKAKHKVEDYGDNYILLAGSQVNDAIDTFDKDNAGTFNYNVTIKQMLANAGIKVVKVFGKVKNTGDSVEEVLLNTKRFILVARNSRIAEGKPIIFVRRKLSGEIAKLMGAEVDQAQRALVVNPTPVNVAGTNKLAYAVYGCEFVVQAIVNPLAIVKCTNDVV
ncbi:hypothetical protein DRJ17_06120 [Candidatus Woesearchaeota archaeon]|nr:MAG: hypothetical protein DRJ17_06120 [Candidatus Woesearchaeota archaeon]